MMNDREAGSGNAAAAILAAGQATPDAVAIRLRGDGERCDVTYGELQRGVRQFAAALAELGIGDEQRVLVVLPDLPELVIAFLGAMWRGAVPVLVNPSLGADYEFFLTDTKAPVVVTTERLAAALGAGPRRVLTVGAQRIGSFWEAVGRADDARAAAATHPDDPAFWLYSSGTTGKPKGTIHVHASVSACIQGYGASVLEVGPADVSYSTSKAFFAYGLGASVYFPLAAAATAVLCPDPFQPARAWALLARERPSLFFSVPSVYRALLDAAPESARAILAPTRRCLSAGEALPGSIFERWREKTGRELLDGLGSTEMLHVYLSSLPGDARPGVLGHPIPGYELKIVDEQMRPVPDGEAGMMVVRGPSMAAGYWRRLDASRRAFQGEWYVTGDRAVRELRGGYRLLGRADDLMKISGQWVVPGDVEEVVGAVPGVRECAVVGRPGEDGLLEPVAFVVAADGAAVLSLVDAVRDRCAVALPRFKRPRDVHLIEALPRTGTGKLQRFVLRELAESRS